MLLLAGLQVGDKVWAKGDLGMDPVLVQKYTRGTVVGPSTSDDKERVSVKWEKLCQTGGEGCNNVLPVMIVKTCPPLPGGLKIGHMVWAKDDLGKDPVLVQKYTRGTVAGPSTSNDKERVSVKWEKLCQTGGAGCNNVLPVMIVKTCPPLPGGLTIGQDVWAKDDLGKDPVLVQKYTKGMVAGPSTSNDKERVSVKWEKVSSTGEQGCSNELPRMITNTCPLQRAGELKRASTGVVEPPGKKVRTEGVNVEHTLDAEAQLCTVCLDAKKTHICVPCGHICVCESCASSLCKQPKLCPLCRTSCTQVIKVFF
ncbi:unnamed protein product [Prorocentrum cordatum]|uniref:RING-type domain-containing protein n=1 Tax=Prorocentrum cordatum TaxID=2364126 RepID=A0ABN9QGJ8_9DINO|nr:unnamed protein product [Polarella glacialis]